MSIGEKLQKMIEKAVSGNVIPSKKWLAKQLGVTESAMYRWFLKSDIKHKYLEKICELVGVSMTDFYSVESPDILVSETRSLYVTKSSNELDQCQQKLDKASMEINLLREQIQLKDEIITMLKERK